jgi:hypothetical protein
VKKLSLPLALAACVLPAAAFAQQTVSSGRGFPIGEKSRIHTKLDLSTGFDTNPGRRAQDLNAQTEFKLRIRPGLEIAVPGQSAAFNLHGGVMIEHYFDTQLSTLFGGDVGADLRLGSNESVVGLELKDTLSRTPTFFEDLGSVGSGEIAFPLWYNRGKVATVLRPGGGALEFRLGYGNEMRLFDEESGLPDSQRHAAEFEAKLRFLPKTAAIFSADMSFFSTDLDATTNRATPYNISIGIQGQITARLSTLLRVGFGDTLSWTDEFFGTLDNTANKRTVIASANLTYAFMPLSSFSIGYDRVVRPVILLDTYTGDAVSGRLSLGIGDRLSFGLLGQYEHRSYSGDIPADLVLGDARVEYWFFEFLRGGLTYQLIAQFADESAPAQNVGVVDYTRHQGLVMVGLYY